MNLHTQPFVYRLRIRNDTGRDFVYVGGELRRGRWYRDGVDNRAPASIPAGSEIEAMGVWAPPGATSGYECRCVWADSSDGAEKTGEIAVAIRVPFLPGKNGAGLDVSGPYRVDGWTGLPKLGREFAQELTIREIVMF